MMTGNKKIEHFLGEYFPKCDYHIKKEGTSYLARLSMATQQFNVVFNKKGEMVEKQFPVSGLYLPYCVHHSLKEDYGNVEIVSALKIYNLKKGPHYILEIEKDANVFNVMIDLTGKILNNKEIEG